MPLPLVPFVVLAVRLGAVATTGFVVTRWARARIQVGRTDQRAEDAMDDLGEGVSVHRPVDRTEDRQTNATLRVRRSVRIGGGTWEIDAGAMARFRLRATGP